jgi:hypothetical protein
MYRSTVIPNTKSIWTRILSETGLVGFAFWLAWLYLVWQAAHFIRGMEKPIFKTIGWAGAFTIIALLAEGFSTDTFALPYLWFSLGLVTAASRVPALQHTDKIIVET